MEVETGRCKFDKKQDIYTVSKNLLHMILLRYKVKIVTLQWRNLSDAKVTKRSRGTVMGKTDKTSTLISAPTSVLLLLKNT